MVREVAAPMQCFDLSVSEVPEKQRMKRPVMGRRVMAGAQMLPVVHLGRFGRASRFLRMDQLEVKVGEVAIGMFCFPFMVEKA